MGLNRRKKQFVINQLQKKILVMVFIATSLPAFIVGVCLYYLIFNLTAEQIAIPEAIAYNLLPVAHRVNIIILTVLPITVILIIVWAYIISHRIAGPLNRLYRELDELIAGKKQGHIHLRKKDELSELVGRINKLLDKSKES